MISVDQVLQNEPPISVIGRVLWMIYPENKA